MQAKVRAVCGRFFLALSVNALECKACMGKFRATL
jgi:hypothetical protein